MLTIFCVRFLVEVSRFDGGLIMWRTVFPATWERFRYRDEFEFPRMLLIILWETTETQKLAQICW